MGKSSQSPRLDNKLDSMKPKICYLSRDPSTYLAALYQNDFLRSLRKYAEVELVSSSEQLRNLERERDYDIYFFGHQWLDEEGLPLFEIEQRPTGKPKVVFFLNKEYANLENKLRYVAQIRPDLLLTHHHDLQSLTQKRIEAPAMWVPFAADPELFRPSNSPSKYDLSFSGVLRNPTYPSSQIDDRERIQEILFQGLSYKAIRPRKEFRGYSLYWRPTTGQVSTDIWNRFALRNWRQSSDDYAARLAVSKTTLNTLSPLGLISTRFFESAFCKSLILTPNETELHGLFEDSHILRFDISTKGLLDVLDFATSDSKEARYMAESTFDFSMSHHTWDIRVLDIISRLGCPASPRLAFEYKENKRLE